MQKIVKSDSRACEAWTVAVCIATAVVIYAVASTMSGCATARAVVGVVEAVGQDVQGAADGMRSAEEEGR